MLLENAYFVAQIVAGVAVVGSLIYVGAQLQQNVRSSKLAAVQYMQTSIGRLEETIYTDNEFTEILRKGMVGESLSEIEAFRLNVFYRHALRTWQSAYYQYAKRTLSDGEGLDLL